MASSLMKSDARDALPWIRDLSLVGGASAVGAPLVAAIGSGMIRESWTWAYVVAAGLAGLLSGALLGWLTPRLLRRWLGRWPRAAFIVAGIAAGGLWGALVGAVAGLVGGHAAEAGRFMLAMAGLSAVVAAPVGALQLGWFWVSAATRRARRRPVHKLVLGAALVPSVLVAAPFLLAAWL